LIDVAHGSSSKNRAARRGGRPVIGARRRGDPEWAGTIGGRRPRALRAAYLTALGPRVAGRR
jgi:hypothetical protein